MEETKRCPKCSGVMEKGIMMTPGAVVGVRWSKGEPSKWWNNVNNKPKIMAYGCDKCGYIENYIETK